MIGRLPLLLLPLLVASCVDELPIEGAACPCPAGYTCVLGQCTVSGEPPGPPAPPVAACDPGPAPLRRLTSLEYVNTVRDLLGVTLTRSELPAEARGPSGFRDGADDEVPSSEWLERMRIVADEVARRAVTALDRIVACNARRGDESACAGEFVAAFGRRAYRRPLTADQRDMLMAAYEAGFGEGGFRTGIQRVIAAALASPAFLYHPRPAAQVPGALPAPLDGWTVATRLSYLLWRTTPDDALLDKAAAGLLVGREAALAQAERLLAHPRAAEGMADFHDQWLRLDELSVDGKSDVGAPFSPALAASLNAAARATIDHLVWREDAPLATLLEWPYVIADALMAETYDLTGSVATGFAPLTPRSEQRRAGILTLPGLLAARAHGIDSAPVIRGLRLASQMLCMDVPAPPPGISLGKRDPTQTTRQQLSAHTQHPSCAGCHGLFDPFGLTLENFDGLGRWRSTEAGQPIDATVALKPDGRIDGPMGLARHFSNSPEVSRCMVRQWFRYSFGRRESDDDRCTLDQLERAYTAGERRTKSMVRAIVVTDAFLMQR